MPQRKKAEVGLKQDLIKGVVGAWFLEVEKDFKTKPFSPEEIAGAAEKYRERYRRGEQFHRAYGTTLIAAAAAEDYWFGIHIGDGKCVACYPDGSWDQPIPWDDKCFLNVTTSVCDDDSIDRARVYFCTRREEKGLPVMVFVNSDGVDDSYPAGDNEKYLAGLYRTIALNFVDEIKKADPEAGFKSGVRQVKEFLPDLSKRGSGDDISIAALIDPDALLALEPILRKQDEDKDKEKADRNAAAAKAAEEANVPARDDRQEEPAGENSGPGPGVNVIEPSSPPGQDRPKPAALPQTPPPIQGPAQNGEPEQYGEFQSGEHPKIDIKI
jgi:hypothetical protein